MHRAFAQVDVFGATPGTGNPVAVVLAADGLDDEAMQAFARWTNLSETTFVLPPTRPDADYRVRIFTAAHELPFAGHPTLGTCHAWTEATGAAGDALVQECGIGLVAVRRRGGRLAFAAPALLRDGPVDPEDLARVSGFLGIGGDAIVAARWCDNGPGWLGVLLRDADAVLALRPGRDAGLKVGVAGPHPPGHREAFEVRTFFPDEDPVTGSFNAALAQWLLADGRATAPYVAAQGTALGRRGRVHVDADGADVWIGGATATVVAGTVDLP